MFSPRPKWGEELKDFIKVLAPSKQAQYPYQHVCI